MKKTKKTANGYATLTLSLIGLLLTYLIYKYLKIDDVFCVILMTLSFVIGVYGIFQIVRDAYN